MSLGVGTVSSQSAGSVEAAKLPIVNDSGAEVPVYGIVAGGGQSKPHASSDREWLQVDYPAGDASDVLLVNADKALGASTSKYGHGWSVLSGPLWVKYSGDLPAVGDTVGAIASSFTVTTGGTGFTVLAVDSANSLVRVGYTGGGSQTCLVKNVSAQVSPSIVECAVYTGALGAETLNGDLLVGYIRGVNLDANIWLEAMHVSSRKGASPGGGTSSVSVDADWPSGVIGPADYELAPWECNA